MTTSVSAPTSEVFHSVSVDRAHAGARLDRFLVDAVADLSRARVRSLIEAGLVRVDGRRARKGDAVVEGAVVELLSEPPPRDFAVEPVDHASVVVRHEDPHVVVFDKPAGMPTHPLRPDETATLANVVAFRYPEARGVGFALREPGLTHRLDTDTSGLVIVARSAEAFESLREAHRAGHVIKRYQALVEGLVSAEGRVDYPLVRHRKDPKRVEAVTPHVRLRAGTRTTEAHTRYRPVRAYRGEADTDLFTLVEAELTSGFRHQVRVHMATLGHPLAGDTLYRGPSLETAGLSRHFLHAFEVQFPHPSSGNPLVVRCELPADLEHALATLTVVP